MKIIIKTNIQFEIDDNLLEKHNIKINNYCNEVEESLREFYEGEITETARNVVIDVSVTTE